jgi:hypothetical protein
MRRALVFCAYAFLAASPGVASVWARVNRSADGDQISIDVSSIRDDRGIRTAWLRTVYRGPNRHGGLYDVARFDFDCPAREMALRSVVTYGARGRVLSSVHTSYLSWRPVVPDSVGEGQLAFVCSYPIGTDPREIEGLVVEP